MTAKRKEHTESKQGAASVIVTAVVVTALWNAPQFLRTEYKMEHFKNEGYKNMKLGEITQSSKNCEIEGKRFDLKILEGEPLGKCLNFREFLRVSVSPFER